MNKEEFLKEFDSVSERYAYYHLGGVCARNVAHFWHSHKHQQQRYMGEDYFDSHLTMVGHLVFFLDKDKDKPFVDIAYLHDILEDTDCTEELLREFFDKDVVDDVVLLTHIRSEPREVYYKKIKTSPRALTVKMADVAHNISCLTNLTDLKLRDRLTKKYMKAIKCLMFEDEE